MGITYNIFSGTFDYYTSVSGTTNRITSTGGISPTIDISASYVGQSSITTVGTLSSGAVPTTLLTGVLQATQFPALTGDITTIAGALATTLATVNSNVGTFGSATQSTQITVNGKGLITAIANVTITPAVGSITGLGTGIATWLATPSSANLLSALTDKTGTGVNVFGTAPTFTTSITLSTANIITDTTTGTKFGTATNQKIGFYNSTPIVQPTGDVITGLQNLGLMASATITATTNANLTGPITSVGNATSIASQTGIGTKFVVDTSPTIITPTFTTNFTSPIWKPAADSTTAIQINKSDGTTNVVTVDTTNGRFGVNTTPSVPFHIVSSAVNPSAQFDTYNDSLTVAPFLSRAARGTVALPTALKTDDIFAGLAGRGYKATVFSGGQANIIMRAAEDWTDAAAGSYMTFNTTPIGGTSNTEQMRILGSGNIQFTKIFSQYNGIATVSNGVPSELAKIDTTGLTANVASALLYAVPASGAGMYQVCSLVVETTAGSLSSTLPNVQIVYTDNETGGTITIDATPILGVAGIGQTGALTANTVGTTSTGVIVINAKASTNIQYLTTNYASNLAGMAYALHIKLLAL